MYRHVYAQIQATPTRGTGQFTSNSGVQVVGTRGDVQPFLAIARRLRRYGHRVRLATHSIYREFVEDGGVEFFPLGGDPSILSEFVVRNRGILPGGGAKGLMNDIHEQVPLELTSPLQPVNAGV